MKIQKNVSLLGKWLKSENTSSEQSRQTARKIRNFLGLSPKQYRKTLSALRKYIDVVEKKLCAQEWDQIDYERVPSRAGMIYRNAFRKHDETRYEDYLSKVEKGEAKINTSVLYPSDIVSKVIKGQYDKTLELQWNNLPNYLEGNEHNGIVVADVSDSMRGQPIEVSIALAIYFAERNVGQFKDHFITFSESPKLQRVCGQNLQEKVENLNMADWGFNTDINKVFRTVLDRAVSARVPESEMPEVIYLISDMQFDAACRGSQTNFEQIDQMYKDAGYKRPLLVFWNLRASEGFPVANDQNGTIMLSGYSPSSFKSILAGKTYTPMDYMLEVLNNEQYKSIKV